jgi:hypothetical protein
MQSKPSLPPLLLLHPDDNVFVARRAICEGETIVMDNRQILISAAVPLGHKVARHELMPGSAVLKYGACIGSATCHVRPGEHVHLHNMKSDYLPSYTRQMLEPKR